MKLRYYRLEGRKIVPSSLRDWAATMETDRRIGYTTVGELEISTVFLGMDHNFAETGDPILWETMVFRPDPESLTKRKEVDAERCSGSFEQAEAMHDRMVDKVITENP